jgi:GDP-L-fucose synthase
MRIYVAGKYGMVGSALSNHAKGKGNVVLGKPSRELDFRDRAAVFTELMGTNPDCLVIAAARVGGIGANIQNPVKYLSENLQIFLNLIDAAHAAEIPNLIFIASSCMYPKNSLEPIDETQLLAGKFEETNEPYSMSKMTALKLVEVYAKQYNRNWSTVIPTNLYGPRDNFHQEESHVLPSLMSRIHQAKISQNPIVEIWGDGSPRREFLHVDDLARALLDVMEYSKTAQNINVGSGNEITIARLAEKLAKVINYEGKLEFNRVKPNGIQSKLLDSNKIRDFGWSPKVNFDEGLLQTYKWYLESLSEVKS